MYNFVDSSLEKYFFLSFSHHTVIKIYYKKVLWDHIVILNHSDKFKNCIKYVSPLVRHANSSSFGFSMIFKIEHTNGTEGMWGLHDPNMCPPPPPPMTLHPLPPNLVVLYLSRPNIDMAPIEMIKSYIYVQYAHCWGYFRNYGLFQDASYWNYEKFRHIGLGVCPDMTEYLWYITKSAGLNRCTHCLVVDKNNWVREGLYNSYIYINTLRNQKNPLKSICFYNWRRQMFIDVSMLV